MEENYQHIKYDPTTLIDEQSSEDYYIGVSKNSKDLAKENWRIKRVWKVGTVWKIGFPDGNQDFIHIWDNRLDYIYSE